MKSAIITIGLRKVFKKSRDIISRNSLHQRETVVALDRVSLEVPEERIYGILGSNGAGKTSLIKILSTSVIPTEGTASICGLDVVKDEAQVKRIIGLVNSDERSFFWRLTGFQNLQFFSSLHGLSKAETNSRITQLLEVFDLSDKAGVRFHDYSTGMKQKLAIARGLINKPRVVFMDEPTRSLDPMSAKKLREYIKEIVVNTYRCTLVLTTHNLDEAEELCDRIAILRKGKVVAEGSVDDLRKLYNKKHAFQLEVEGLKDSLLERLRHMEGASHFNTAPLENGRLCFEFKLSNTCFLDPILREIIQNNVRIYNCSGREASFEEIFFSITS